MGYEDTYKNPDARRQKVLAKAKEYQKKNKAKCRADQKRWREKQKAKKLAVKNEIKLGESPNDVVLPIGKQNICNSHKSNTTS